MFELTEREVATAMRTNGKPSIISCEDEGYITAIKARRIRAENAKRAQRALELTK